MNDYSIQKLKNAHSFQVHKEYSPFKDQIPSILGNPTSSPTGGPGDDAQACRSQGAGWKQSAAIQQASGMPTSPWVP